MLTWTIYFSFLGMAVLMCLPKDRPGLARWTALATSALGLACGLSAALDFDATDGVVALVDEPWVPALGINFHLAVDGIGLTLVLLTGVAAFVGVLFSWNIERSPKEFFAYYFALIGGCYGVFLSFDLFLLFVFYEIAIVPKYFLGAAFDVPGEKHADERRDASQQHERESNAVHGEMKVDAERRHPGFVDERDDAPFASKSSAADRPQANPSAEVASAVQRARPGRSLGRHISTAMPRNEK